MPEPFICGHEATDPSADTTAHAEKAFAKRRASRPFKQEEVGESDHPRPDGVVGSAFRGAAQWIY